MTDTWTSPNHRTICAWTVHLEHDGQPLSFLLDIIKIPESHTGVTLAQEFHNMLLRFGIENKVCRCLSTIHVFTHVHSQILSFNADNASPNDKQTDTMATLPNSFEKENRVRCFNHMLQLSAKALVSPFNAGMKPIRDDELMGANDVDSEMPDLEDEVDDGDDDADTGAEVDETAEDPDNDINELDQLDEEERNQILEDTNVVRASVSKLRNLSFTIINSTTLALLAWHDICTKHGLKQRLIPRDVVTRWNSTFDMLEFALKYREAIDAITAERTLKLRKYELEPEDWLIIEDLAAVLGKYKIATLYFSSNAANISAVIPAMDQIDSGLNTQANRPLHTSIKVAMKLAQRKINRYYSLTDLSSIYRISMGMLLSCSSLCALISFQVLHPGLKLEYFRQHEWEAEWIEAAEDLVREEYSQHYKDKDATVQGDNGTTLSTSTSVADFGNISVAQPSKVSEMDRYLREPVENTADPLKWWFQNQLSYLTLSRMALDYLIVPATSTGVERVFSLGRQLLPFMRCRLSVASMRAYLCLGSWCRCDLVGVDVLHGAINESLTRKRKHVSSGMEDTTNA